MSKPKPLDRRTLLKVKSRIAGRCTCDTCDPDGDILSLRNWLEQEARRTLKPKARK